MQGRTFGPLCQYALGEDKNAQLLAANRVRGWSAEEMAEDFDDQRALRPGLGRAALHIALAWPAEEKTRLTDKLMAELAREYLEQLKIDPDKTQWVLVRHHDQAHPHCHLIVNRVTNAGGALRDSGNFAASARACRNLEEEYGLVSAGEIGDKRHRALVERHSLGEREAVKLLVKDAVNKCLALPAVSSMEDLRTALAAEGVKMDYPAPESKRQGVVFTHVDHPHLPVKGSEIGKEYGIGELRETLASYAHYAQVWAEEQAAERAAERPRAAITTGQWALVELAEGENNAAVRLQRVATALQGAGAELSPITKDAAGRGQLLVQLPGHAAAAEAIQGILRQVADTPGFRVQHHHADQTGDEQTQAPGLNDRFNKEEERDSGGEMTF